MRRDDQTSEDERSVFIPHVYNLLEGGVTRSGGLGAWVGQEQTERNGERHMRPRLSITVLVGFWLIPVQAVSQDSYIQKRTQEIVASFNKQKYAVKEKYGVRKEKYKTVRSEPVIKENIRDYSGVYEVTDLGYLVHIQVGSDGNVKAVGSEPANGGIRQARRFRLEGANIRGAMLTATKVYEDGATEPFEGVFVNRTESNSPTDNGVSVFGLGVVGNWVEFTGVTLDRLFYQLTPSVR